MSNQSQAVDVARQQEGARAGAVLAVVSVAAFMASLDLFIVNVALPYMGADLGRPRLSDLSWVLSGYAIVYAALLVPLGRLADRRGRRAGFLLGLALFTVASAGCAVSQQLWQLDVFRLLQAVGAAALTPTSLALLLTATPAAGRARAVRIWAATGALAAAAGPVVGGLLVEASWRWVFLINLPVGVGALLLTLRLVGESRESGTVLPSDVAGAGLLTATIGALALGLVKGPDWGWESPAVLGCLAGALAGLVLFWLRSLRHPSPVIEPALLRVRSFAWSNATALLFSIAFAANLLALVLWMQQVWGYGALRTGLAVAAGPAMVPLLAAVAQRISARVSAGVITAAGCAMFALGAGLLSLGLPAAPAYASDVLPGLLVGGSGVGLALPTILAAATTDLPAHRTATGSAVVNMSRQIGAVLGVSILVAVLGFPTTFPATREAFQHIWWVIGAVS
ncbi:MAG: drug resistance transporter, EmrB/QacA subfamily, partial [Frankiales bacterium]|nr:drug resistance transporter, EmrB/QacA subfamily [Frankiales bacterium]